VSVPEPAVINSTDGLRTICVVDDPDAEATSPEAVYRAALHYVDAGLSVIPIDAELGSKSPDVRSWKIYQFRLPRVDELQAWYDRGRQFGLAVVAGAVSGGRRKCGLEVIDFDTIELAEPWMEKVNKRLPGLIERLVLVQSPRPGLHVYFRSEAFGECQKLARALVVEGQTRPQKTTLIELRGEGGYCVVPPSPWRCHPSGELYRLRQGSLDLTQVPIISAEERNILIEEARSFNRWTESKPKRGRSVPSSRRSDGNRPGDDYARRVSWAEILEPHGWVMIGQRGEIEDWRRPGKHDGISATVNYADTGKLYVFSTNADPFEEGESYSKFSAYTLLNHGGHYSNAARALQDKGYGQQCLAEGGRLSGNVLTTILGSKGQVEEGAPQ
jgi:hypothetical protein